MFVSGGIKYDTTGHLEYCLIPILAVV